MKKQIARFGIAAFVLLLAVAGYAAWRLRSLNTPEVQAAILARTRAVLGADVRVTKMDVSLFSGVTLEGITVANPSPFEGDLLAASSFVLRYRLWPLLRGRLEVERAAFVRPQLNLAMDARGRFNYEGLGAPGARPGGRPAPPAAPQRALPIDLRLRSLTVREGTIVMRDARRAVLMKAENASLSSQFEVTRDGIVGSGTARVGSTALGEMLFVRDASAPLRTTRDLLTLSPIRASLARGTLAGEVKVNLKKLRYAANLKLEDVDVATLLEQARSTRLISGRLAANGVFEGSGGLATLAGKGRAEVADCRISNARVLLLLSRLLQLPELANPDFDTCLAEFTLGEGRLRTPVLRLEGRQVRLTGRGNLNLLTNALDYEMTLALAQPVFRKLTSRELRAAFTERPDGFAAVDFRLTGTTAEPQTDLVAKVGKAAAVEAIRGGLDRLFGKRK